MALKDMKSDLSKFRMPKKEPLQSKERTDIKKNQNQTPLSSMVESAPKIPRSQTTTNKEGVNPQKVNQAEKFKGETTPQPMDNSEKFKGETTPKPMSLVERYLGQTDPTKVDQTEKFKGETSPTQMNNESNFLGETTPKSMDNSQNFLGETTPKSMDNSENFLGETTPNSMDNASKFLGETTPSEMNNQSNFLGETTPSEMNNQSNFLGETTPNLMDNSENFLGETTPSEMNNQSNFLGETTPSPMNNSENFLGETTPSLFSQSPKLENEGKDFQKVNYFQDIHATGFNSKFGIGEQSKFVGINPNNTVFDSANSLHSNIDENTFTLGKTYGSSFNDAGGLKSGEEGFGLGKGHAKRQSPSFLDEMYNKFNLRDDAFNLGTAAFAHPLILRGIQRKGLSKGEPQRWGFGFPVDDGLMRGGIVTATDRSVIDAVRLGKWMISVNGLLWGVKQLGLQASNSNVETVTGKRLTKVWTPVNTIASAVGNFLGLHPRRHGLLPLPEAANPEKYETVQKAKKKTHLDDKTLGLLATGNRLVGLFNESFITIGSTTTSSTFKGTPFLRLQSPGGPNTVYGVIPGGKIPTRGEDTRLDIFDGFTIQNQYKPVGNDPSKGPTAGNFNTPFDSTKTPIGKDIVKDIGSVNKVAGTDYFERRYNDDRDLENPDDVSGRKYDNEVPYRFTETKKAEGTLKDFADSTDLGKNANNLPDSFLNNEKNTDGTVHPIEKLEPTQNDIIKSYETLAYGNIPTRGATDTQFNDFRENLTGKESELAKLSDYKQNNLEKKSGFNNPASTVGQDKTKLFDIDPSSANTRWDAVNALRPVASESELKDDLVKFYIQPIGKDKGEFYQFRGTINGLTETFSPSWDSIKFAGRADQGYKYGSFERSVTFNFQMWATSRIEMKPMYEKLEALSTFTMPLYRGERAYQGILVEFTLGDLYKNKLSFIESLTYTFSDDAPWDVNLDGSSLGVRPMGIDIAIGFKVLDDVRPEYKGKVYDLGWTRGA